MSEFRKAFQVYIKDKELAKKIIKDADEQGRSESAQIVFMVKKFYQKLDK